MYLLWEILISLFLFVGFVCLFAVIWYIDTYGDMGFDSIMFTLLSGLNGVQSGLVEAYLLKGFLPAVICTVLVCAVLFFKSKRRIVATLFRKIKVTLYPFSHRFSCIIACLLSVVLILIAAVDVRLVDYIESALKQSAVYQEKYVDPLSVNIEFPEQKQNLIYIYLESMETTFLSKEQGGAIDYNLIPELYSLAQENINFSNNSEVGGFKSAYGTNWTAGAMVASTSGIPLKAPSYMSSNTYGKDSFLPGANTLMNVLKNNGYYQVLMVGSDASFANRDQYYKQHGTDKIYDLYTAYEDGIVPEGYNTWWGMEDRHLYTYAMLELPKIAAKSEPFAFTMLTVDTHHIGGYMCEKCENIHSEQYENVINCASRQLYEFINWLKTQDFYENTTVVISGDHITMDSGYITRNTPEGYARHVYNCFVNAKATPQNSKNRVFTAMDMFPTILAAMGCTVEGERLGLGTNLFSSKQTLAEEMGLKQLNAELSKASKYYIENFMV